MVARRPESEELRPYERATAKRTNTISQEEVAMGDTTVVLDKPGRGLGLLGRMAAAENREAKEFLVEKLREHGSKEGVAVALKVTARTVDNWCSALGLRVSYGPRTDPNGG